MKNKYTGLKLLTAITAATVSLVTIGCSDRSNDKAADKIENAYETSKDAVADTWDGIKGYTYEKSDDFKDRAEAMSSDFDAKIEKLKADTADAKASASRSAAWEELKNSRADLDDKLEALGDASADTWESAKANVVAAAKRVEAAYDKAKADNS